MKLSNFFLLLVCICFCCSTASAEVRDVQAKSQDSIEIPENIDFYLFGGEVVAVCGADISAVQIENGLMFTDGDSYPLTCSAAEVTQTGCVPATGDIAADMTAACGTAQALGTSGAACPAENGSCARCTGGEPPYTEGTCKYKDNSAQSGTTCSNYRVENDEEEGQQVCADVSVSCKYRCKAK